MIFREEYNCIKNSSLFDANYYLENNIDVKNKNINPLKHFIKYGWKEGRNPSEEFNTNYYLELYPDVVKVKINPLFHYLKYGKKEGRIIKKTDNISYVQDNNDFQLPIIPDWVISEMKSLSEDIDSTLYPSQELLQQYKYYNFPVIPEPGIIYKEILKSCSSNHYSHCFALPWLKRGGADFVALQHIEFAVNLPNSKVIILLTEPGDSPWLYRLPKNVDIVDISKYTLKINYDDLLSVITKLLVQLKIDVIHIINSRHLWEIVKRHGLALKSKSKIFASLYCDDYNKYKQPVGYARDYLPYCYKNLTKVFSDNESFPKLLCKTYGYSESLFKVLKSPIEFKYISRKRESQENNVLWAGRLDIQKRPDLLLKIVQNLPDVNFSVYGEPLLESQKEVINELSKQTNLEMKGAFNGVESLPFNEHLAFLYTSQWDGIPTIIIAAASVGIPIVASNVGGVGEVVSSDRGYLIDDYEDIQLYVDSIKEIIGNKLKAEEKGLNAQNYVKNEHNVKKFNKDLINIDGYTIK